MKDNLPGVFARQKRVTRNLKATGGAPPSKSCFTLLHILQPPFVLGGVHEMDMAESLKAEQLSASRVTVNLRTYHMTPGDAISDHG